MADRMTAEQRHRCMSRIRGKDTKPELIVRRWLWQQGFRYRLHVRKLPGSPDIVMRKIKTVIFINGCFWHGHNTTLLPGGEITDSDCCRIPHSNRGFWLDKITRNVNRDVANVATLQQDGWHIITVWECELRPKSREATLDRLLAQLTNIISAVSGSEQEPHLSFPSLPEREHESPSLPEREQTAIPVAPSPRKYAWPEEAPAIAAEPQPDEIC